MGVNNLRSIGFENSYLNLGGGCRYHVDDSSVVVTRETGWWFLGTIAGSVAMIVGLSALLARRKGRLDLHYGLSTLVAPPLELVLALAAPRRPGQGRGFLGSGRLVTYIL